MWFAWIGRRQPIVPVFIHQVLRQLFLFGESLATHMAGGDLFVAPLFISLGHPSLLQVSLLRHIPSSKRKTEPAFGRADLRCRRDFVRDIAKTSRGSSVQHDHPHYDSTTDF
jgi:hypothetical protein